MPDMLVLTRDKRSGAVRMMMEIDPSPEPAWTPGPTPTPGIHKSRRRYPAHEDVAWARDAVLDYVAECEDLVPESIMWSALAGDLDDYIYATSTVKNAWRWRSTGLWR
jgi:hypothetical protein